MVARAALQVGHAILAARDEWIRNEKDLLPRADVDLEPRLDNDSQLEPAETVARARDLLQLPVPFRREAVIIAGSADRVTE
jgi:hypothetical protein